MEARTSCAKALRCEIAWCFGEDTTRVEGDLSIISYVAGGTKEPERRKAALARLGSTAGMFQISGLHGQSG